VKILFVSEIEKEVDIVRNITKKEFPKYDFVTAGNQQDVFDLLTYDGPFAIIIIDTHLKNENPSTMAENILEMFGNRAIIFCGEAHIISSRVKQELYQNQEMTFVYEKPFSADKFVTLLKKALVWIEEEKFENSIVEMEQKDFVSTKLRNFYLFKEIPFNAYIQLGRNKFILAITENTKFSQAEIRAFQRRGIKNLHIQKNEHLEFLESSIKKIISVLNGPNIPINNMIQIQVAGVMVTHQYLRSIGISDSIQELAEELFKSVKNVYTQIKDFSSFVMDFPFEHKDMSEQAILKIYFCLATCEKMKWNSDLGTRKLFLTGLIHDYCLQAEEMSYITNLEHPVFHSLDEQDQEIFRSHITRAKEFASFYSGFNDAEFIIEQHHELPDGTGFPQGVNAGKLPAISCIFILNSNFVTQLISIGITKNSIKNLFEHYLKDFNIGNFKEPLKGLRTVFKLK
jgi:hypothetical protein